MHPGFTKTCCSFLELTRNMLSRNMWKIHYWYLGLYYQHLQMLVVVRIQLFSLYKGLSSDWSVSSFCVELQSVCFFTDDLNIYSTRPQHVNSWGISRKCIWKFIVSKERSQQHSVLLTIAHRTQWHNYLNGYQFMCQVHCSCYGNIKSSTLLFLLVRWRKCFGTNTLFPM